ncbi:hypothetical protein [Streptomyces sp. AC495_CC817]|uniref:hypothetical protein n=1 Tax=Streptomyces sp. AC495_CC817 TaxID=2823900 RepID=UPI001C26ADBA|nr:hypothetical protein [Streptomyces sp. AC495_CC817]
MLNQILCVAAWPGVPSVAPCKARDVHLETCANPDCPGCFPRNADRGFLCQSHYDRFEHAYTRWDEFDARASDLGLSKAVERDNAGVRATADGHVNLTGVFLAVDECRRHLLSLTAFGSIDMWISTEEGAKDAIQFAAAAERAYRAHEVEERPHRIRRVRCPECQQQMIWNPPAWYEGHVTVKCTNDECRHLLTQDEFEELEQAS